MISMSTHIPSWKSREARVNKDIEVGSRKNNASQFLSMLKSSLFGDESKELR